MSFGTVALILAGIVAVAGLGADYLYRHQDNRDHKERPQR